MSSQEFFSLLPLLTVMSTSVLAMLAIAWRRSQLLVVIVATLGLCLAFSCTLLRPDFGDFAGLLIFDSYARSLSQLLIITTICLFIFTYEHAKSKPELNEEFYLLLLLSLSGALIMVASNHFMSFFLGLELLTIPLYAAIGYYTHKANSLEAAIKYIILAGLASGMLLFGAALIYASFGTMNFELLAQHLLLQKPQISIVFLGGLALVIVAIAFKISAVPFHLWTPDVYAGAPLPATAFLATISKAAALTLFLRLWVLIRASLPMQVFWALMFMAMLSMLAGNLLALRQNNLKRLLAYSSIAQFGYITMALLATGSVAMQAVFLYFLAYILTMLIIFGILMCSNISLENIDECEGLFSQAPAFALMFFFALLSLMGMPLTALFMAKFLVIMAGIESSQWPLIITLIISSGIGVFVYLRIINAIMTKPAISQNNKIRAASPLIFSTLALLTFGVLFFGLFPTPVNNNIYIKQGNNLVNK